MRKLLALFCLLALPAHAQQMRADSYRVEPGSGMPANIVGRDGWYSLNSGASKDHPTWAIAGVGYDALLTLGLRPVATTAPSSGEVLTWNGSAWAPAAGGSGSGLPAFTGANRVLTANSTNDAAVWSPGLTNVGLSGTYTMQGNPRLTGSMRVGNDVSLFTLAGGELILDNDGAVLLDNNLGTGGTIIDATGGGGVQIAPSGLPVILGGVYNFDPVAGLIPSTAAPLGSVGFPWGDSYLRDANVRNLISQIQVSGANLVSRGGTLQMQGGGSGGLYTTITATTGTWAQILPGKDGTFAMLSDLDAYLPLAGGIMNDGSEIDWVSGANVHIGSTGVQAPNAIFDTIHPLSTSGLSLTHSDLFGFLDIDNGSSAIPGSATHIRFRSNAGVAQVANGTAAFSNILLANSAAGGDASGTLASLVLATVTAAKGGTGFASYAVGDMLYADTTTTLAKLADVAAGSYMRSGGTSTAPVWSTLTLPNAATQGDIFIATAANAMGRLADVATGQVLHSGGVGANPAYSAIVVGDLPTGTSSSTVPLGNDARFAPAPGTQGRVLYDTGAAWAALAVGTDGQVLTTHGASSNPTWTTPTGGVSSLASSGGSLTVSAATGAVDVSINLAHQNTWTKSQNTASVALTDAASIATDASLGNVFTVTLGGNRTLANPTNLVSGGTYIWIITQDGTGSRTLAYGSAFAWPGALTPTLSTTAGRVDTISAVYDGTKLRAVWTGDQR